MDDRRFGAYVVAGFFAAIILFQVGARTAFVVAPEKTHVFIVSHRMCEMVPDAICRDQQAKVESKVSPEAQLAKDCAAMRKIGYVSGRCVKKIAQQQGAP